MTLGKKESGEWEGRVCILIPQTLTGMDRSLNIHFSDKIRSFFKMFLWQLMTEHWIASCTASCSIHLVWTLNIFQNNTIGFSWFICKSKSCTGWDLGFVDVSSGARSFFFLLQITSWKGMLRLPNSHMKPRRAVWYYHDKGGPPSFVF